MAKPKLNAGGGFPAIKYTWIQGRRAGGVTKLYSRLRSKNVCKTCALGMGGQRGGMINEDGHFPSVCKKSMQAQASDMQGPILESALADLPLTTLREMTPRQLEYMGRVAFPMVIRPGGTHVERCSWDEAMDAAAASLRGAQPDRTFFYASGRASNEAAFLLQLVARAYGCPHIHNCSYYCHSASGVALNRIYGSGTASVVLDDLIDTDFVAVVGANPASNHPRLITELVRIRRKGGKVVVINPMRELGLTRFAIPSSPTSLVFGSEVSDLYLQPRVGTDAALMNAVLKRLAERGALNQPFINASTEHWEAVEQHLSTFEVDGMLAICGIAREELEELVDYIESSEKGIFAWAMGLTHQYRGVEAILSLGNIALSQGWLGRTGAGMMPIRGHSNVQGVGSMGVSPKLKQAFAQRLTERYGVTIQTEGALDTFGSMQAAERGEVDAAFLLGGNLFSSNPDREWAKRALSRVATKVYVNTTLNEGHVHPGGETTYILPPLARDEESQSTTQESMFNFVRLSDGGPPNLEGEMRSEVAIVAELAERILPADRFEWSELRDHNALRASIAAVVPGYAGVGRIGETKEEFQIDGRTFHAPRFSTESGRARFHVVDVPETLAVPEDHLRLMTLRSEGQFNTVVFEEEDLYRGNERRDIIMLNADDAEERGISEGDRVVVESETRTMEVTATLYDVSRGGAAMYYPEANSLVPARVDSRCGTPAYKSVTIQVRRV